MYLCISHEQTFEQAQEMVCLGLCEAPRVVAAKIDRDRQDTRELLGTFLLQSAREDLEINNLASPPTVDILIQLVKYNIFLPARVKVFLPVGKSRYKGSAA